MGEVCYTIKYVDLEDMSDVMTYDIDSMILLNAFLGMKNILKYDGNDMHIKLFESTEIYSEFSKSNGNNLRLSRLIHDTILRKIVFFDSFINGMFVVSRNKLIMSFCDDICAFDFYIKTIIINDIEYTFDDNDEINLVQIEIENNLYTVWLVYPFEDTVEDFMNNECLDNEIIENVSIVYTDGLRQQLYTIDDYENTSL